MWLSQGEMHSNVDTPKTAIIIYHIWCHTRESWDYLLHRKFTDVKVMPWGFSTRHLRVTAAPLKSRSDIHRISLTCTPQYLHHLTEGSQCSCPSLPFHLMSSQHLLPSNHINLGKKGSRIATMPMIHKFSVI
jgi:hypothetical protein